MEIHLFRWIDLYLCPQKHGASLISGLLSLSFSAFQMIAWYLRNEIVFIIVPRMFYECKTLWKVL